MKCKELIGKWQCHNRDAVMSFLWRKISEDAMRFEPRFCWTQAYSFNGLLTNPFSRTPGIALPMLHIQRTSKARSNNAAILTSRSQLNRKPHLPNNNRVNQERDTDTLLDFEFEIVGNTFLLSFNNFVIKTKKVQWRIRDTDGVFIHKAQGVKNEGKCFLPKHSHKWKQSFWCHHHPHVTFHMSGNRKDRI